MEPMDQLQKSTARIHITGLSTSRRYLHGPQYCNLACLKKNTNPVIDLRILDDRVLREPPNSGVLLQLSDGHLDCVSNNIPTCSKYYP